MIRVVIVDDEAPARELLREYLATDDDCEIVAECANGFEAVKAVAQHDPDLLLLDIQMPKLDGFEVLELLDRSPLVVFVTAHDEHALRAFEVHALDYVLKPFSAERFRSALMHARQHLSQRRATDSREAEPAPPERRDRLVIKSSGRNYVVRTHEIDWCEAAGNYVRLHVGAQTHLVRGTMGYIESQLDSRQFVRVHRSTIVNVDRIEELRSSFNGEYVILLHDKTRLTLSRGYRDGLQTKLGKAL